MEISVIVLLVAIVVISVLTFSIFRKLKKARIELVKINSEAATYQQAIEKLESRYSAVIDADKEAKRVLNEANQAKEKLVSEQQSVERQIEALRHDYKDKKAIYDALAKQVAIYSDDIEMIDLGFYEPQFDFDAPEKYKEAISLCRESQKKLVRDKSNSGAIYCTKEWVVEGSRVEGRKMTEKTIRLTARAFNNECDAAIAKCTWKNAVKMLEKIKKAYDAINKLNEPNAVYISPKYLELKLKELQLTYEYHEQKQKEKDEQAEIRAQMREEAKAEAEIKKAEADAIKEELRYQKALEVARKELESASEDEKAQLQQEVESLQQALLEAELKHQRAQSMAEQTKRGHVYVISNIGSFGENVFKIGMTRRLEPMHRVTELGDASVPFTFDVHAMIYTDDAPALEKALHDRFDQERVNLVNKRKEFFQVSLGDIQSAVQELSDLDVEFIQTALAKDYHESKGIRHQADLKAGKSKSTIPEFEETL